MERGGRAGGSRDESACRSAGTHGWVGGSVSSAALVHAVVSTPARSLFQALGGRRCFSFPLPSFPQVHESRALPLSLPDAGKGIEMGMGASPSFSSVSRRYREGRWLHCTVQTGENGREEGTDFGF